MAADARIPFLYVSSSSYSGSTLLAFLLNTHPDIFSVSEMDGWPYGEKEAFRCSCGEILRECPFFRTVASDFAEHALVGAGAGGERTDAVEVETGVTEVLVVDQAAHAEMRKWLARRLDEFFDKYADPKYDLRHGGRSKSCCRGREACVSSTVCATRSRP